MIHVECTTERRGGVTLVTAVIENDGPRRRVRLAAEGEVWPPRRRGVPAAGWEGSELAVVLAGGERRAVGYATPDELDDTDDPLSVAATERPDSSPGFEPSASVPTIDPTPTGVVRALDDPAPPRAALTPPETEEPDLVDWLDAVEKRMATAESLAAAETLDDATAAVAEVGDLAAVRELAAAVESDREALVTLRTRLADLLERSGDLAVPVETFERLA